MQSVTFVGKTGSKRHRLIRARSDLFVVGLIVEARLVAPKTAVSLGMTSWSLANELGVQIHVPYKLQS